MFVEKPLSPIAQLAKTVRVSSETLKEFAHHIEQAEKLATPGHKILIPFTRDIVFVVEPDIKSHQIFGSHFTGGKTVESPITRAVESAKEGGWVVQPGVPTLKEPIKIESLTDETSTEVTPH